MSQQPQETHIVKFLSDSRHRLSANQMKDAWGLNFGIQAAELPGIVWDASFTIDISLVQGQGDEQQGCALTNDGMIFESIEGIPAGWLGHRTQPILSTQNLGG